jgi:hypothetical protein
MPFFPVLFLVLRLRDVLVTLHPLGRLTRFVEIQLTGVLGAHGHMGKQPLQIAALALRAGGRVTGPQELLELVMAAPALVFVDRHWGDYTNSQIPNPNSQIPTPNPRIRNREGREDSRLDVGSWELEVVSGYTDRSSGRGSAW